MLTFGVRGDHIRPDEDVDFNVAFPDPYRGSLPQPTHADIILSQGTWIHRLSGIVTTHYSGSSAQQFSFANAASFGPMISGFNIVNAADCMHWCNTVNHRCLITFGWNEIPCDERQLHFMRAGHSFVLHIQTAWPIIAAASDNQHQGGESSQAASHSQRHAKMMMTWIMRTAIQEQQVDNRRMSPLMLIHMTQQVMTVFTVLTKASWCIVYMPEMSIALLHGPRI